MIRFVLAAVWICAVTVGSIFFAFSAARSSGKAEVAPAPYFGGLDYVKTDVISVPIVRDRAVDGYFLARFVFTVEPAKAAAMSVPAATILVDEAFTYIYGHPLVDFTRTEKIDVDGFRVALRDSINARVGQQLVHEVLIEQLDYLSKQEIRDNTAKRRTASAPPATDAAPKAAPAH
ncbi:MAG: hypothetical protein Q8Q62_06655 [Mesorhizobium sp.]|nr:hypothetical protein [Mesorhizobium sp.]